MARQRFCREYAIDAMTRLESALDAIQFSRAFTNGILDSVPENCWYRMPEPAVTHVAWQVGHLAWAQDRLLFKRVLAGFSESPGIVPPEYLKMFGIGSRPEPDEDHYPAIEEIRSVFDSVYANTLEYAATIPDSLLDEPSKPPHPAFNDRYGALLWIARHELVHAGQIGLLRRLFGEQPLR